MRGYSSDSVIIYRERTVELDDDSTTGCENVWSRISYGLVNDDYCVPVGSSVRPKLCHRIGGYKS